MLRNSSTPPERIEMAYRRLSQESGPHKEVTMPVTKDRIVSALRGEA